MGETTSHNKRQQNNSLFHLQCMDDQQGGSMP